jgi:asparagine synthase (glutamine-hydrolysing)
MTTNGDAEVAIHLYEELGENCVSELRGMFAFAIWDGRRRKLLIFRDRVGIKPLYYSNLKGELAFGSEIKALLQHPHVHASLDMQSLGDYLARRHVPGPRTLFSGISSLPPGHILTCDRTGVSIRRYWDLSFARNENWKLTEDEAARRLKHLLDESVELHLMSDVPFGAFLSGGVDSSTVVALMSHHLNRPVKTFAVGYEGSGSRLSELPMAQLVSRIFETDHSEVIIGPQDFIETTEKVIWHLDQPIADAVLTAYYRLAQVASSQVKMVLTGEGGDELFAGYARYSGELLAPWFEALPPCLKSLMLRASTYLPGLRAPKQALYALAQTDEVTRLTNWHPLFNSSRIDNLISDDLRNELNGGWKRNRAVWECLERVDTDVPLHRFLYVDTKTWLPDDLLTRGDKLTMAASLEARVPLLDSKVVEFAASLNPNLKIRNFRRKYLLKKVSGNWLPDQIVNQRKKGFPIPVSTWLRHQARPFMRDLLSPEVVKRRGLFSPEYVGQLMDEHEKGIADHERMLFGLIGLETWMRLFIDPGPSTRSHLKNATPTGRTID